MKNYIFATISLAAALLFTACDQEAPMDTDLYPQTAYIVGAHYRIIDEYLDLSYEHDTVNISVAISGNRSLGSDVKVTLEECPEAIDTYNQREVSARARQYRPCTRQPRSTPSPCCG